MSFLKSFSGLKCPRCRKGDLFVKKGLFRFTNTLDMHDNCSSCGLKYDLENGFWLGAMWISYPLVVALELPFLFLALFADGIMTWVYFCLMIIAFAVFLPFILRVGRALWIYVNVPFDGNKTA